MGNFASVRIAEQKDSHKLALLNKE